MVLFARRMGENKANQHKELQKWLLITTKWRIKEIKRHTNTNRVAYNACGGKKITKPRKKIRSQTNRIKAKEQSDL